MEDIKNDIQGNQLSLKENAQLQEIDVGVENAVDSVKGKIMQGSLNKVDNQKSINKHSSELAKVANGAIRADIEKENLKVKRTNAENKVEKQGIKNQLIALKTETKRLKREHKQILKEQKAEHKKRNKDILWAMYEKKLTKMGYGYVPNIVILKMLLTIDGIVSFFEGIGKISTAVMKAIKWLIFIGVGVGVLMAIPATRVWVLNLLGFIK